MLSALSAPALALLISVPGLPGLHLPGFGVKHRSTAARDTIPPPWKTASRLALEDRFVLGAVEPTLEQIDERGRIQVTNDERRMVVSVDPDSGEIVAVRQLGDVDVGATGREKLTDYSGEMLRATFRRQWADKSRQSLNTLGDQTSTSSAPRTGLSFELPGLLPRQVQSLLGPGSPALNVSGSENIRLSGESNWSNQQIVPLGQKKSIFPSLDMQQDLNIQLEGQLSDRIRVNLLQNSLNQIPLANRIAINYKGDEDDVIQELDLGNTNLSLPGTQYVSYSGLNEGLFGIKAASRFGPLDVTVLATKQQGKSERASYSGGASRQTYRLYANDYIKGAYFLLYDPNVELLQHGAALDIPDASISVYRDDRNSIPADITVLGAAMIDPTTAKNGPVSPSNYVLGSFKKLLPGADQDFEILTSIYGPAYKVLKLRQPLSGEQVLAVTYTATRFGSNQAAENVGGDRLQISPDSLATTMKLIRPPLSSMAWDSRTSDFQDSLMFTSVRHLELDNFYQLPGQNIDLSGFHLDVEKGDEVPARISTGLAVPYLEIVGLDNFDETTGRPVLGHDGRVDGAGINDPRFGQVALWLDPNSGILHFLEPRPFAPHLDAAHPFEQIVSATLNRRDSLTGGTETPLDLNAYDRYNPDRKDILYRLDTDFTAQRVAGAIDLGRGNIMEGSEVVTVNGRPWMKGVDYDIDYDLGKITLRRQLGPADNLNIDYSYAPLFQQAGRTLVGGAFQLDGVNKGLGGAFMYESRGAQDLRPRLGEEPARSVIGDLNGKWDFTPTWMTRMVDHLPGIRTTTPSDFSIEGEAGASFPNPNTKNEVYIDDMEGVRDAVSVPMAPDRWRWSGVPSRRVGGSVVSLNNLPHVHNGEIHWYSPFGVVHEWDLKPNMTAAEGGQNNRQVLALSVPRFPRSADPTPPPGDPVPGDSLWAGITYPLDQSGIDLSKSQFIELWVNDYRDQHEGAGITVPRVRGHHVRLHIDLGTVSEDQQRAPDEPPNGQLDSEDKGPLRDNQLVVTDTQNEDTGYDGLLDPQEKEKMQGALRDLTTASPDDPEGDDFGKPVESLNGKKLEEIDTRRYRYTNGTEGNKVIFPFPDTEGLYNINSINTAENFFEYTVDLGDDNQGYLATDVYNDYSAQYPGRATTDNGWRRYRIPISDSARVAFGSPNLSLTRQVRVWLEGIRTPEDTTATAGIVRPLVILGGLDIVASRWRTNLLPDSLTMRGETVTLNSVNTVDNADIYKAPFDPGQTRSGNQQVTRREQAISLEFTSLQPQSDAEAYKTLSIDEDYTRYLKMGFYAASHDIVGYTPGQDSLYYFVRFSSDEQGQSYYEYRSLMPSPSVHDTVNWQNVILKLTDLSGLKPAVPTGDFRDSSWVAPGVLLSVIGTPSFTRLRRLSFGVMNRTDREFPRGQLWFDEIRATDVDKAAGYAGRLLVNGRVANLATYSASFNGRDENFVSVGEQRGQGSATSQFSFNTSIDTQRFFEGTGIQLPVTYGYTRSGSNPRFTVGDDVVRQGAYARASQARSDNTTWSATYTRQWSERSNPLLLYTVGGLTGGFSNTLSHNTNAASVDTTKSFNGYVSYRQGFRKLLAIPMPSLFLKRLKIFPLPEQVNWSYNLVTRESRSYDRKLYTDSLVSRPIIRGRAATLIWGTDFRPVDLLTYHIDGTRNMSMPDSISEHVASTNVGANVGFRQNTNSNWTMNRGAFMRPTLGFTTNYAQDNGPQLSDDLSIRQIASGQSYTLRWDLPFDQLIKRTRPQPMLLRTMLSRLGPVSAEGSYNRSSSWSRMFGVPDFPYLFGFSDDPTGKGRMTAAYGNQVSKGHDWRAAGRTRIDFGYAANVNVQAEFTSRIGETNGVDQRSDAARFPDLSFDYGHLTSLIRLDRFLQNPQIRTAYNRNTQTLYQNSENQPTSVSVASQWQPLLSMRGSLKNGASLDLGVERRVTQRTSFLVDPLTPSSQSQSITTDRQTTVNFSINRSYTQGQKLAFLGKTSTVRSSINLGLSANYDRRSGDTQVSGLQIGTRNVTREDRLSVQGNGSYGFSNNVTGTATLGFQQNRDLQKTITNRSVRVELRGSFTF